MEKKRKDIEARLAYNEARANQFRDSLKGNSSFPLEPILSLGGGAEGALPPRYAK
jgi:hypothetical protein